MIIFLFVRFPEKGLGLCGRGCPEHCSVGVCRSTPASRQTCLLSCTAEPSKGTLLHPQVLGLQGQENVGDLDGPLQFTTYQRRHRMGSHRDLGNT